MSRFEDIELAEHAGHGLGERAAPFAALADARLDALLAAGLREELPSFAPADPVVVDAAFAALETHLAKRPLFLEWGAAAGLVTGLAALRGWRAHGIEIVPRLADAAREVLAAADVHAEICAGSFVPDGFDPDPETMETERSTIAEGADAYDDLGRDLDEFEVVYAYPWPGAEGFFDDLFEQYAAAGTIFVTYHGLDGVRARRLHAD